MQARVWRIRIRHGKLAEFKKALLSLIPPAQQQEGFRGVVALSKGKKESPEVTLLALWDTLEAMRASERNLLVMQAISRFTACSDGVPHIEEQEILAAEFHSAPKDAVWSGRVI